MNESLLNNYISNGYPSIEGWFHKEIIDLWLCIDKTQLSFIYTLTNNVIGGTCEIGVHHGKLFLPLAIIKNNYVSMAIDVFDDYKLNSDGSGRGNLETFMNNLKLYAPDIKIIVKKGDSAFLNDLFCNNILKEYGAFSIFFNRWQPYC